MSWILLRGLTREARHWGDFAAQLADQLKLSGQATDSVRAEPVEAFPERSRGTLRQAQGERRKPHGLQGLGEAVIAIDLPGNGEFASVPSPDSVRGMVDFLRAQVQTKALPGPHKVLAMSLGGMVAVDWAQRYPAEVTRLVLINTSMRPFSSVTQRLRPGNWLQLALLAARWRDADHAERVIHQLTCNNTTSRDQDLVAWLRIRKSAPVTAANAARQFRAAAGFFCAAAAPPCATLILSSAADHLVHPICSARLAGAWQATHQQHPWAGHDLPHDDADWVCRQLMAWLDVAGIPRN